MKRWMRISALGLALACVGCATGRHLQFKHPASGLITGQITLPNPETCSVALSSIRITPEAKDSASNFACATSSASHVLPLRATLRDRTHAYLFDLEVTTITDCKRGVDAILAADKDKQVDLVAPCASK